MKISACGAFWLKHIRALKFILLEMIFFTFKKYLELSNAAHTPFSSLQVKTGTLQSTLADSVRVRGLLGLYWLTALCILISYHG